MPLSRQCELAGVTRSTVYAQHLVAEPDALEMTLLREIDAEYTRHPFYGSRKMTVYLCGIGHQINRKRIQRLMRILGLAGMTPHEAQAGRIRSPGAGHPEHGTGRALSAVFRDVMTRLMTENHIKTGLNRADSAI